MLFSRRAAYSLCTWLQKRSFSLSLPSICRICYKYFSTVVSLSFWFSSNFDLRLRPIAPSPAWGFSLTSYSNFICITSFSFRTSYTEIST